jgi:hypothetical protein
VTVERVTDPSDVRLVDYVGLTDVALRRSVEPAGGLVIAESEKVIRRALATGHRPRSFLMAQRWLTDLADVAVAWDIGSRRNAGADRPVWANRTPRHHGLRPDGHST